MTNFATLEGLRAAGFSGFRTAAELLSTKLAEVPQAPGVYLAVRTSRNEPKFAERSCGGHFKGDPTVPCSVLEANWIRGAIVVYIGKAGGGTSKETLRKRLRACLRFGRGSAIGHRGGRYVWQLEDSADLLYCWRPIHDEDARLVEARLIQRFVKAYGGRPFANLTD